MPKFCRCIFAATAFACAIAAFTVAARADSTQDEGRLTIGPLLQSGWQVAGYGSNSDNRSTFILFKHPSEPYLVQCLTGYDVTRDTPIFENCYRLR